MPALLRRAPFSRPAPHRGAVAHGNRRNHLVRRRVDPRYRIVARIGHPDSVIICRDKVSPLAHVDSCHEQIFLRVDTPDFIALEVLHPNRIRTRRNYHRPTTCMDDSDDLVGNRTQARHRRKCFETNATEFVSPSTAANPGESRFSKVAGIVDERGASGARLMEGAFRASAIPSPMFTGMVSGV